MCWLEDVGINLKDADLLPKDKEKLADLLLEYTDVFSSAPGDIGHYRGVQQAICLKPDTTPVRQHVRRIPLVFQNDVKEQIQRMLKWDY